MRRREREVNIFNIAFLDVITGAMGAFVLMVLILAPYYAGNVANQQHEKAVTEKLDSVQKSIQQASMTASQSSDPKAVQPLLQQASSALNDAKQNLDGMRQQLDQLSAQNARVKAVDEMMQKQVAQLKDQQTALNQQLKSMKSQTSSSASAGAGIPLVIQARVSCPDVSINLYAISQYRPGHSFTDPDLDPGRPPSSGADDATYATLMDRNDKSDQDGYFFQQWTMVHGEWRSQVRIYYAVASPLGWSALMPSDHCRLVGHLVMKEKAYLLPLVELTSDSPLALVAIATISEDGSVSIAKATEISGADKSGADAWLASTAAARNPLQAALQGNMTDDVRQSLTAAVKRIENGGQEQFLLLTDRDGAANYSKARSILGLPPPSQSAPRSSAGGSGGSAFPFGQ